VFSPEVYTASFG